MRYKGIKLAVLICAFGGGGVVRAQADEKELLQVVDVHPTNEQQLRIWVRGPIDNTLTHQYHLTFPAAWPGEWRASELSSVSLFLEDGSDFGRLYLPIEPRGDYVSMAVSLTASWARKARLELRYRSPNAVIVNIRFDEYAREDPYQSRLKVILESSLEEDPHFSRLFASAAACIKKGDWHNSIAHINGLLEIAAGQDPKCRDVLEYLLARCRQFEGAATNDEHNQ